MQTTNHSALLQFAFMKKVLTLACTVFALCCLCPQVSAIHHQEKTSKASSGIWFLQQNHTDLGLVDIYIASDEVKVVSQRSGYELICKAPSWEVHGFRRSTKLEWISPLRLFDGLLLVNPQAFPNVNKAIFLPRAKGKTLGLNYTHFVQKDLSLSSVDGTADFATAPEVLEFLRRFYRSPNVQSVPLVIRTNHGMQKLPKFRMGSIRMGMGNDLRSGLIVELTTKSWEKIPYKADIFALPLHYKRTMTLPQVTFSPEMKNQFDEIFRDGTGFRGELHGSK